MKLISMKDFVLEQSEKLKDSLCFNLEINARKHALFADKITNYANFLNQPLTLGMFVPCDEDSEPLKETHLIRGVDAKSQAHNKIVIEAKERVLFEFNQVFFEFIKGAVESNSNLTVEWLVDEVVCTLTQSAQKQIEIMKTDNKEEAKRLADIDKAGLFIDDTQPNIEFYTKMNHQVMLVQFHNHMKDQYRFHPETFERVVKPKHWDKWATCSVPLEDWNQTDEEYHSYANALTLDQLIERCKEMRVLLKDVTDEMDYIDEEYDELPGLLNKVRRRISDLIKK